MSISVDVKMTGDISTPEHQAAVKKIMDAVEQAVSELPGIGYPVKGSRTETKTWMVNRGFTPEGLLQAEPIQPPPYAMHEARLQFGFHLNPVKQETQGIVIRPGVSGVGVAAFECPDKQS